MRATPDLRVRDVVAWLAVFGAAYVAQCVCNAIPPLRRLNERRPTRA